MTDLHFRTATELAADIRAKRIGCLELLDLYWQRVERINPRLNAIVVSDIERARERARAADAALARGESWGPLHGLPMTVKESYNVAGWPTTWGDPSLKQNVAATNAVVIDRLIGAGANIVGKTNVPLHLQDFQSYNDIYGTTNNPWDMSRTPGGSSGGSAAALAAGLTALEVGSDIGGSIRNPAHFCGVYGHKPTWGIVPTRGHSMGPTLAMPDLSVLGPLARGAEDLALAMDVIAGPDVIEAGGVKLDLAPPRATVLKDFRVAVLLDHPHCPVDAQVGDRLQAAVDAIAAAGAKVETAALPGEAAAMHDNYMTLLRAATAGRMREAAWREMVALAPTLKPDDRSARALTARGAALHHRQWQIANEERQQMRMRWHAFFQRHDVLLCPIMAFPAIPHEQEPDRDRRFVMVNGERQPYGLQIFWAGIATNAWLPATIAPVGLTPGGLPVGMQIVGPAYGDRTTIEFARLVGERCGAFTAPAA